VVDVRNGKVRADGANIDLPLEGQHSFLRSLETADVIVEVHEDTLLVTKGTTRRLSCSARPRPSWQMNNEKAEREKDNRTNYLTTIWRPVSTRSR
jgi:hypothetical protein